MMIYWHGLFLLAFLLANRMYLDVFRCTFARTAKAWKITNFPLNLQEKPPVSGRLYLVPKTGLEPGKRC